MPVNIIQKITYLRVKVSVFCFVFLIKKEEEEKKNPQHHSNRHMIQKIFVLLGSQKALAYSEMVMIQRSDTLKDTGLVSLFS